MFNKKQDVLADGEIKEIRHGRAPLLLKVVFVILILVVIAGGILYWGDFATPRLDTAKIPRDFAARMEEPEYDGLWIKMGFYRITNHKKVAVMKCTTASSVSSLRLFSPFADSPEAVFVEKHGDVSEVTAPHPLRDMVVWAKVKDQNEKVVFDCKILTAKDLPNN